MKLFSVYDTIHLSKLTNREDAMKQKIIQAIDRAREQILACGEYVLNNPELGFKEEKTAQYVKTEFAKLGIPYREGLAITGVLGTVGDPEAPIHICVIGEMDAVKCFGHPKADPVTGAAHACGHNAQIAQMIGAAYGIVTSGMLEECKAKISFLAVPAKEFAELDYRKHLVEQGKLAYMSGKQELLHRGLFDNVDIAMMIHAHALTPQAKVYTRGSSLGFEAKQITFTGRSAHGSEPWNGVNALDAAVLTLTGIHANRATFQDGDRVRIHPILSNGGDLVNVIPDRAVMETYVRAANSPALADACRKVDNAAKAGALAVGAQCEIENIKGYAPLKQNECLSAVFEDNARLLLGNHCLEQYRDMTGSTDMGDLSAVLPVIQPTLGGFDGALHSKEFAIVDKELVYLTASKLLACTVYDLIKDGARLAKEIKQGFAERS